MVQSALMKKERGSENQSMKMLLVVGSDVELDISRQLNVQS